MFLLFPTSLALEPVEPGATRFRLSLRWSCPADRGGGRPLDVIPPQFFQRSGGSHTDRLGEEHVFLFWAGFSARARVDSKRTGIGMYRVFIGL